MRLSRSLFALALVSMFVAGVVAGQFSRADLSDANLGALQFNNEQGQTWLQRVNLSGANMRYIILRGANLQDAIMMGVDLSYAILIDCDLRRADLTGAILTGADLTDCLLTGTIIEDKYRPRTA